MIGPRRRFRLLGPALAGLSVLAVGGTAIAAGVTVHVGSFYFEDATEGDGKVVAEVGDQLRLVFDDSGAAGKRHAVEVVELGIYSGPQPAGATWVSPVITTAGTFQLVCRFHKAAPNSHLTTLVVTGTSVTPKPTPKSTQAPTPRPTRTTAPTPAPSSGGGVGTPSSEPGATSSGGAQPGNSVPASPGTTADAGMTPPGSPATSDQPGQAPTDGTPAPSAVVGELPVGGSGPGPTTWLRSVWVAILALVPIAAFAAAAAYRGSRRDA